MKIKTPCVLALLILAASLASGQTITRCGGPSSALYINWPTFHFDVCHTGDNPYEHTLSPSNVGNLTWSWWHGISQYSVTSSPALVNGFVYITTYEGDLYALNASTGTQLWKKTLNAVGNVAVVNGVLYVDSSSNSGAQLYALDAGTGSVIWQYAAPSFAGSPTVAEGIVYVNMSTSLYAFDAANGTLIWQQPVGGSRGAPAVVNGIVYTGSSAGGIFALNARTGAVIWTRTVATDISSAPAVVNGVVYVGGDYYPAQTVVYALNALNGAVIWNRTLQDATSFSDSSPAVANGVVYVSTDLKAWAFDASNGTLVWQHLAPIGHGQSAPGVANGVVYLGSSGGPYSGGLYALDASNGNFLWGYSTDSAESDLSSPAIANGMVFFGTADGLLYAFHLPNQ